MEPSHITAIYVLSRSYRPHVALSLATLPAAMPVIVSWCHADAFPPELARPGLEFVRATGMTRNFCKSYALNLAIRRVSTPWVLVCDADMLFPAFLTQALGGDGSPLTVRRFYIARFNDEFTRQVMRGEVAWDRHERMFAGRNAAGVGSARGARFLNYLTRRIKRHVRVVVESRTICFSEIYGSPNPALYSRELLERLHGYDETIEGWGGEDRDLHERGLRAGAIEQRLPLLVGHLQHPATTDFPEYQRSGSGHALLGTERPMAANDESWGRAR